jgi:hypothetical protein
LGWILICDGCGKEIDEESMRDYTEYDGVDGESMRAYTLFFHRNEVCSALAIANRKR